MFLRSEHVAKYVGISVLYKYELRLYIYNKFVAVMKSNTVLKLYENSIYSDNYAILF